MPRLTLRGVLAFWVLLLMSCGIVATYARCPDCIDPWRIVAVISRDSAGAQGRAEHSNFNGGLPPSIRFASTEPKRSVHGTVDAMMWQRA